MKKTTLLRVACAAVAIVLLAGCTASKGGNSATSCSNTITKKDVPVVSMWAWYPNMELAVDNFNKANDDVQVCWTNVGQGGDEYDKFQTAITAGTGAPDVIMVEADRIPTFQLQGAIVDIRKFGFDKAEANYSAGSWKDVSVGEGLYGVPVDGGPMGMIYRADVFTKYGITPPTTWKEYEDAAQKVKDAGGPLFGDLGANVPAVMMALQVQKGAQPFEYDPAKKENISISLNDGASKDVLDYWAGLVKKGLVGTQDQFTPEYISGVVGGSYATYISAAWAPGYLTGAGVGEGEDSKVWAVAPLPQWDASSPVHVNWGGSAFSVSSQAKDKALAARVAFGVYSDAATLDDGWKNQVVFPLNLSALKSPEFIDLKSSFFNGQQANKEVYVPAADGYEGMTYTPFGQYYFDAFNKQLAAINSGSVTGSQAADLLQKDVVAYAKEQGFTVD